MSILYIRCTEAQLLSRRIELASTQTKNLHRVTSIVLLITPSPDVRNLIYSAQVNRADIKIEPRSPSTATLDIIVHRYTRRQATEHDRAYASKRAQHQHIRTEPRVRAELRWSK